MSRETLDNAKSEKAVDIPKKALDCESYKLYYVNYKIFQQTRLPQAHEQTL
jgi:hypothetical protein